MDINDYRTKIDEVDKQMVDLFCRRMKITEDIAKYKKENSINVLDTQRERKLLDKVEELAGEEYGDYARRLYSSLMELSRANQVKIINPVSKISSEIEKAKKTTPQVFPDKAVVACQGIEGAYSLLACEKLFKKPSVMFCQTFEAVFQSVESGLCRYGVVPLENSNAGSVNQIYTLMSNYKFRIVRSVKMHIGHCMLVKSGTKREDIKEIYSHPQAISQCSEYLGKFGKDVKIIPCENTAVAAKIASESDGSIAAISSLQCAAQYSLEALDKYIQNTSNNYTRFICFSKNTEVYPGADRTSLLIRTPHRAGSLYSIMSNFYSLGINIIKLESRPIPESDFEFMFYFDIEVPFESDLILRVMSQLEYCAGE